MNKLRIASLLASGLPPSQVASIVGVTPARISQLARDDQEFQNLLAEKTIEAEASSSEEDSISAKYMAAEHMLLNQVIELAPVSELRDVTAALRVVAESRNAEKQRKNPIFQGSVINQTVVQLSLPTHALPEIHLGREANVIAIDATSLAPLSSQGVTNLFKDLKDKQGVYHDQERTGQEASCRLAQAVPEIQKELVANYLADLNNKLVSDAAYNEF